VEIKWKEFLLQEFPKGEIIHGKHGKELNIDCISPDCPSPKDHMFVNMGSDNPKHDKRFICHRCGVSGNHKAFLTIYYALPYDEVVKKISQLLVKLP